LFRTIGLLPFPGKHDQTKTIRRVLHFAFPRIRSERLVQHDSFDGAFLSAAGPVSFIVRKGLHSFLMPFFCAALHLNRLFLIPFAKAEQPSANREIRFTGRERHFGSRELHSARRETLFAAGKPFHITVNFYPIGEKPFPTAGKSLPMGEKLLPITGKLLPTAEMAETANGMNCPIRSTARPMRGAETTTRIMNKA
jgi:hypothetical protein